MEGFEYVSVGGARVHEDKLRNVPYRWRDELTIDEQFQILLNGEWQDAQSIDFEFPNELNY
jgi:hypothetical protein